MCYEQPLILKCWGNKLGSAMVFNWSDSWQSDILTSMRSFAFFTIILKFILLVFAHQDNALLDMVWLLPLLRPINHLGMWKIPTRNFYQMCDLWSLYWIAFCDLETITISFVGCEKLLCLKWVVFCLEEKRLEQAGECFIKHSSQSEACSLLYAYI